MSEKKLNFEKNKRLRDVMTVLNLSQVKIGKILGVSQPDISRMYSDLREVGDSVCWSMVCKLSINPIWLEYGRGEMFIEENGVEVGVKTSDELVTDLDSFTQMSEDLKTYRRMVNSLNDIIDRQNRRIDELESQVKNSKDVNSDFNPHNFKKVESNMFNK